MIQPVNDSFTFQENFPSWPGHPATAFFKYLPSFKDFSPASCIGQELSKIVNDEPYQGGEQCLLLSLMWKWPSFWRDYHSRWKLEVRLWDPSLSWHSMSLLECRARNGRLASLSHSPQFKAAAFFQDSNDWSLMAFWKWTCTQLKNKTLLVLREEVVYTVLQLNHGIVRFSIFQSFQSSMKLLIFINQCFHWRHLGFHQLSLKYRV